MLQSQQLWNGKPWFAAPKMIFEREGNRCPSNLMHTRPARITDLNICYQMKMSYTTDYVWQMRTQESERSTDIHFDLVRLPRPMRVDYPRSPDELMAHWEQKGCFFVGQSQTNDVIGFLDALPDPWHNQLWIPNLVVTPAFRRQGLGGQLLQAAHRWAGERNLGQLLIEVQTKNYPGISFAQKHGFQFCGYNERYYLNGDIALFFSRSA